MQPRPEDRARSRLIAELEALDRQEVLRIIGLQADLELSAHAVWREDRANRQPYALGRGAGGRTGRVRKTRRCPLPEVRGSLPLGRSSGELWAAGIELGNWDD